MKNIIKLLFGALFVTGFLTSCEKDENKVFFHVAFQKELPREVVTSDASWPRICGVFIIPQDFMPLRPAYSR